MDNFQDRLRATLRGFSPEDQKIALLRFGLERREPRLSCEVMQELGISRARLREVEARVLRSLRERP